MILAFPKGSADSSSGTNNKWIDASSGQIKGVPPGQHVSLTVTGTDTGTDTGTGMTRDAAARAPGWV